MARSRVNPGMGVNTASFVRICWSSETGLFSLADLYFFSRRTPSGCLTRVVRPDLRSPQFDGSRKMRPMLVSCHRVAPCGVS